MRVGVVADSTVSAESAALHGLLSADRTVSLPILIEGERLDDRLPLDALTSQVAMAQASRLAVATSRPSVSSFRAAYEDLAAEGCTAIVVVVISAQLSGTHESALAAAHDAPVPVTVLDARASGWAMSRCIDAVVRRARAGDFVVDDGGVSLGSAEAVRDAVLSRWNCAVVLSNLDALRAGGRAPAGASGLLKAFGVKPVVTFAEGGLKSVDLARSQVSAVERALKHVGWTRKSPGGMDGPLVVETYGVPEARARVLLTSAGYEGDMLFAPLPLALAVHLGPASLALSGWGVPERADAER
jgi:DegV family protein with EDD domain